MSDEAAGCGCLIVIIAFIGWAITSFFEYNSKNEEERKEVGDSLNEDINDLIYVCILEHLSTLVEKERQCTYEDDYGNIKIDGFDNEFEYFIKNVIYKQFVALKAETYITDIEEYGAFDLFFKRCMLIYEIAKIHAAHEEYASDFTGFGGKVRKYAAENSIEFPHLPDSKQSVSLSEIATGEDYENYIKDRLEEEGFSAKLTPATGDQGVDLIVQTSNGKVAVQCKYYSSKVGNQAVQEVNAGKVFYNCSYAAVVSNNGYTPAARKLAYSLGVCLCNENSLISLLKEIDAND